LNVKKKTNNVKMGKRKKTVENKDEEEPSVVYNGAVQCRERTKSII